MYNFLKHFTRRGFNATFSYHGYQVSSKNFWTLISYSFTLIILLIMISILN